MFHETEQGESVQRLGRSISLGALACDEDVTVNFCSLADAGLAMHVRRIGREAAISSTET